MPAKINHVAIISENYALAALFYESVFGLRTAPSAPTRRAVTVGDGYVGLNINPRKAGRPARFDHFGIEVDDIERALAALRSGFPEVEWLQRPPSRPFASTTTHDPAGNVFDLSQRRMQQGLYAEDHALTPRYISHFGLRTMHAQATARFYADAFGFTCEQRPGDPNFYVSDGHVTIVVMPWHIGDYDGTGIVSPAPDHIGFRVESLAAFRAELATVAGDNPRLAPFPVGGGSEGRARLELARRSCPLCEEHLTDVDGVLLSVAAAGA